MFYEGKTEEKMQRNELMTKIECEKGKYKSNNFCRNNSMKSAYKMIFLVSFSFEEMSST